MSQELGLRCHAVAAARGGGCSPKCATTLSSRRCQQSSHSCWPCYQHRPCQHLHQHMLLCCSQRRTPYTHAHPGRAAPLSTFHVGACTSPVHAVLLLLRARSLPSIPFSNFLCPKGKGKGPAKDDPPCKGLVSAVLSCADCCQAEGAGVLHNNDWPMQDCKTLALPKPFWQHCIISTYACDACLPGCAAMASPARRVLRPLPTRRLTTASVSLPRLSPRHRRPRSVPQLLQALLLVVHSCSTAAA